MDVCNLRQSCQQVEDAFSQGMDKLQQTLSETVAATPLGEGGYLTQMNKNAMEKLDALVSFVNQVRKSLLITYTILAMSFIRCDHRLCMHLCFAGCVNDTIRPFVVIKQADYLRQETLQQMARILTVRQAARGLLALGEYFQRLRALSSLWVTRPREPA